MCAGEQIDNKADELENGALEAERVRAVFRKHLDELSFDVRDLAHFLRNQGGYPIEGNHEAPIKKMLTGDTEVLAELFVIVRMLVRQQRRLIARHAPVQWNKDYDGVWRAKIDDYTVQIRGKKNWQITCFDPDGNAADWRLEVKSLEIAKKRALLWVEEGQNDRASNQVDD